MLVVVVSDVWCNFVFRSASPAVAVRVIFVTHDFGRFLLLCHGCALCDFVRILSSNHLTLPNFRECFKFIGYGHASGRVSSDHFSVRLLVPFKISPHTYKSNM